MALHHMLRAAVQQQAAGSSDPYFYDVSLLLTGDGTNGAQNNTFLDSSSNAFTITRNGNTTQGTFSPYGDRWSNYFDGTGDYLITPSITLSGNFTIEFWVNLPRIVTNYNPLVCGAAGSTQIFITTKSDGTGLRYGLTGVAEYGSASFSWTAGAWYHVALVRSGTSVKFYLNGTDVTSTSTADSTSYSGTIAIAAVTGLANTLDGYMSNVRINTTALYTSNFTPSTTPLTAISGTSLLTCQSNRFIDNSSNNFTLTVNGNMSVQRFSPFNPTAAYDATTIGGSGYFNGTGDYLTVADNAAFAIGTGDFEISCWVFITSLAANRSIVDKRLSSGGSAPWILYTTTDGKINWFDGTNYASSNVVTANTWNYVTVSRVGTTLYLFINGVNGLTQASYTTNLTTSGTLRIGTSNDVSPAYLPGYISNFRFIKGAGVSSVTVPTAPLTAITNTSLLTNFTNAGIPDAAMMNDLETVGNAQVSTSVKKYGTGSLYFPATASSIKGCPFSTNLNTIFNGDFTVEFWYYPTNAGAAKGGAGQGLFDTRNDANAASSTGFAIYNNSTGNKISVYTNSSNLITSTTSPSNGTWYHIALTRSSGTMRLFINGTQEGGNASYATAFTDGRFLISGVTDIQTGTYMMFEGYLDDFRITKGYARYTANFTPPTAALPVY